MILPVNQQELRRHQDIFLPWALSRLQTSMHEWRPNTSPGKQTKTKNSQRNMQTDFNSSDS